MIIGRSPLRISLGGGGTDLPSYYRQHGGFLVAAAINQYVYVTLVQTPLEEIILRYSKIERVKTRRRDPAPDHPRGAAADRRRRARHRDHQHGRHPRGHGARLVGQLHDLPAARCCTSSSGTSCTRASWPRWPATSRSISSKEPVGKQDQYIAAFGGVTAFEFNQDDTVTRAGR